MSKVLIIEDEVAIADLEKDYLELSDFQVDICNSGDEGLDMALKGDYNLVILDLMLPGMDGFEVCRKIREEKNIPILMVSAKKDDIDKIRGLGLGADDYMTKPFSPSELVARVKAHMARYERLGGTQPEASERHRGDPGHPHRQDGAPCVCKRRGEDVHHQGVRPADLPGGESQPCVHQGGAVPGDLGHGFHRRHRYCHGAYQEDSGED